MERRMGGRGVHGRMNQRAIFILHPKISFIKKSTQILNVFLANSDMTKVKIVFIFAKKAIGTIRNVLVECTVAFFTAVPHHMIWARLNIRHFDI